MNTQANLLRSAVEAKRQELIKGLASAGHIGISDGRTLKELTLSELQKMFRNVKLKNKDMKKVEEVDPYVLTNGELEGEGIE